MATGEGLEPPRAVTPADLETAAIAAMRTGNKFGAGRVNRTPSSFEAAYKAAAIPLCETGRVWLRVTDSNCRCSWLMRPEW
jgi:hypothetical protein